MFFFTGEFVGWLYDGDYCKQSIETAGLQVYGGFYNKAKTISPSYFILLLSIQYVLRNLANLNEM